MYAVNGENLAVTSVKQEATSSIDVNWLNEIAARITEPMPIQAVLKDLADSLPSSFVCDTFAIYLRKEDDFVLAASAHTHAELSKRLPGKVALAGWLPTHRALLVIHEQAYNDERFKAFDGGPCHIFESFVSAPMVSGGRIVGIMNLHTCDAHPYNERELKLIATLARFIGSSIEITRLTGEKQSLLERLDSYDEIAEATRILQNDLGTAQKEAYLLLQKESRKRRKSMKEIAAAVILCNSLKNGSPAS